jgi:putative MATE family efflux protein
MNKKFGEDFSVGSIPRHLVRFSVPILMGMLLSAAYNIINAIWVGNILGGKAVGAVAVVFPIMLILIALITGVTNATSILVSQYYGAGDHEHIRKVVNNSWTIAGITVVLVTSGGLLTTGPILKLMGTPPEIFGYADSYLKITILSFAFMYIAHLLMAILRGIGNTMVPMVFMIISTVLNGILDPLLIIGIGPFPRLGLNGAADASLISVIVASGMGLLYMRKKYAGMPVNFSHISFEWPIMKSLITIGLPGFLQQAMVSFGYAFVTFFINSFGTQATAAFGITSRIDTLVVMPAMAVFSAVATLSAQNIGAGKFGRIREIFKWGVILNSVTIIIITLLVMIAAPQVMRAFVKDEQIIKIGVTYLRIVGIGYFFFAISFVSGGIINGAGKSVITMLISFISLCLARIPIVALLAKTHLGLKGIWVGIVLSYLVTTVCSVWYYLSERWKRTDPDRDNGVVLEAAPVAE